MSPDVSPVLFSFDSLSYYLPFLLFFYSLIFCLQIAAIWSWPRRHGTPLNQAFTGCSGSSKALVSTKEARTAKREACAKQFADFAYLCFHFASLCLGYYGIRWDILTVSHIVRLLTLTYSLPCILLTYAYSFTLLLHLTLILVLAFRQVRFDAQQALQSATQKSQLFLGAVGAVSLRFLHSISISHFSIHFTLP